MTGAHMRKTIELLYTGRSRNAAVFRYGLIGFDLCTIAFFIATAPLTPTPAIFTADIALGALILADFLARLWIAPDKKRMLRQLYTIADILVILSLLLAPIFAQNLVFLRVLRAVRLLHSYHVLRDLRRDTPFFRRNEEVIVSAVNLGVFIFLVTALVFVLQFGDNPHIGSYIDALYFTVATLTTTGFGDVILTGNAGRLLAVFIMVVGVALFLRLAQTIFRPQKVSFTCPDCGLGRHEPDAIHCKHCGHILKIETEGAG
ncbi:MAG: potassium channel family protein [Alphaproteobacteria bacterium]|nr:potassium channel family protein [Alphaproteobacteria bacterium]